MARCYRGCCDIDGAYPCGYCECCMGLEESSKLTHCPIPYKAWDSDVLSYTLAGEPWVPPPPQVSRFDVLFADPEDHVGPSSDLVVAMRRAAELYPAGRKVQLLAEG